MVNTRTQYKDNYNNVVIYDLETTGLKYNKNKILESSFYLYPRTFDDYARYNTILFNPEMNIPPESTKIHKITNEMVKNKKTFKDSIEDIEKVLLFKSNNKPIYLIAHNNYEFDELFIRKEYERINRKIPEQFVFIDSLPIVRNIYPKNNLLPNHKLTPTLKEYLNIQVDDKLAHSAEGDIAVLISIWDKLKEIKLEKDLLLMSLDYKNNLQSYEYMTFGKYNNILIKDIPDDYINWMIKENVCNKVIFHNNQYIPYLHNRFIRYNSYYNSIYILNSNFKN